MGNVSNGQQQLAQLKAQLNNAINSRSALEEDFNKRSTMLTEFIAKLSSVCKGLDLELDNKLAKLRNTLKKSGSIEQLEKEIEQISKILTSHASKNEKNIRDMHNDFHEAGSVLQQSKGIPPLLRRNLRELLTENSESKDALIQYVPKLSELLTIYAEVLKAKNDIDAGQPGKIGANASKAVATETAADASPFVERILSTISEIKLSQTQQSKLEQMSQQLKSNTHLDDGLLNIIAELFNIVVSDIERERQTAKSFLSTLSGALLKLQRSIKSGIVSTQEQKSLQKTINQKIAKQLSSMIDVIDSADSLNEAKQELNTNIEQISKTLSIKSKEELAYFQALEEKLAETQAKVRELEKQSQSFEKRLIEQQKKSMQDALTKLNNRAAFDEYMTKAMVRFAHKSFDLAIAVIDLDDFKSINDTFGHSAGDKTLQVIASTLSKTLGESAFIARYGGEEFILVFEGLEYGAVMLALDELRVRVSKLPFKFKNKKVNISTSIGVTHIKDNDNVHQAFERADQALYKAKHEGKNRVIYAE
ncbi:MAG: GGDEF domain-containing protein [Colwelliaceae bacterium]|nr:GGDEF domain-containing protein [Colwelliaceae bacterium]